MHRSEPYDTDGSDVVVALGMCIGTIHIPRAPLHTATISVERFTPPSPSIGRGPWYSA